MKKMEKRFINPMPESLNDTRIGPDDVVSSNQAVGVFGEPGEQPTSQRQSEINETVRAQISDEMLNREILDEKIRQDIENSKRADTTSKALLPRDYLKALIAKGEYSESVVIHGATWTFRALNQADLIMAFGDVQDSDISLVGRASILTLSQIAYAVEAINGFSVYEWFPDLFKRSDFNTTEEFKLAIRRTVRRYIERLPNSVIAELNDAYAKIEKKRNEAIAELKKS